MPTDLDRPTTLLLIGGTPTERLFVDGVGAGWRVATVPLPAPESTPDALADRITDLLARPETADRLVIAGSGAIAAACLTVADRHPERVAGVIAVDFPAAEAGGYSEDDLACPVLTLPEDSGAAAWSRLRPFLAGLADEPHTGDTCPVRLTALTPTMLNEPDIMGRLRAAGPVHRLSLAAPAATWVLTGHDVTTTTLADPALIGGPEMTAGFRLAAPGPGPAHRGEQDLVTVDGELHALLRRLVAQHLTPRRAELLRPRIQRETDRLLDAIDPAAVTDLMTAFARPLPIVVLCELLGIPEGDRDYIEDWLIRRMTAIPPDPHPDVDAYLSGLIAAKRAAPADDLISAVILAEGDALDEAALVSAARWLMVGGHRAPTTLLGSGVAALLQAPGQWQRLAADPELVASAVEELLRFITPFPLGLARHVTAPLAVGDRTIPAGSLVAASLVAANHDPSRLDDPGSLRIDRDPNPHLAFGHGHHYCVGAAVARVQARVAFGTLARRFPRLRIADDGAGLDYRQNRVRYLLALPVVLDP
ncbi:cytochrome P450 [Krasilnikovia sp. MM14-A1004]|uniref:cytochrome P450 n=1 Tax=Krasilnikovia sp. MM14-A1004 TaxID=3373541 RepID=UPI00399CB030